jgi:hypothetical protein
MQLRDEQDILKNCGMPIPVGLHANMDLASSGGVNCTIITKDDSDWCWQGSEGVKPIAVRAHGA